MTPPYIGDDSEIPMTLLDSYGKRSHKQARAFKNQPKMNDMNRYIRQEREISLKSTA